MKASIDTFADLKTLNGRKNDFDEKFTGNNLNDRSNFRTKAQEFINLQKERTKNFLLHNKGVKICPADKGGRVVITDEGVYKRKMMEHITMNVNSGTYHCLKDLTFEYVREICESKYRRILESVNDFLRKDYVLNFKNLCTRLNPEPFIISRIYGLLKIHKEDYPLRPIISSTDCMAKSLSGWILTKLNLIATNIGLHQIHSSHELFTKIDGKVLNNPSHKLATFDFDSMFTNIPFQRTKEIIKKYYHLIEKETTMPVEIFLEALTFLVEETAFFTYGNVIYLQTEGLAMGNSLSQMLAEITTSHCLNEALSSFKEGEISFLYKYVDDIIFCGDGDLLTEVQSRIESCHGGMKLKLTTEDEKNEVIFLDLKVGRNLDVPLIYARWTQKVFSAKRIIDFHSYHPYKMKIAVVKEYVKNALSLTSPGFRNHTVNLLRKILRNSSYEHSFINEYMNVAERELNADRRPKGSNVNRGTNKPKKRYITCPYNPGTVNFLRKTVKEARINGISIAPLIRENSNKNVIYANLKDNKGFSGIKNSSFIMKCKGCDFKVRIFTGIYDVDRTARENLSNVKSVINEHCKSFGHEVDTEVSNEGIRRYRNEYDCNIARNIFEQNIRKRSDY